jgi:Ca2+ transporting ATPase
MGGANEILTDKTGTLTQNKMTVTQFYCEKKTLHSIEGVSIRTQQLIINACVANSTSHIVVDPKSYSEKRVGSQTECALLDFVNKSLFKLDRSERSYEQVRANQKILKLFPFNSDTKKMTVAVEIEHDKVVRIYTKGASENIVDSCVNAIDGEELEEINSP